MKKTRKIISLLLSLLMIITSVPLMAVESFAADTVKSGTTGECTWTLDGTVLTISGNGNMGEYYWPLRAPWGTSITKVVIEDGVTSIGYGAFSGCTSLTSVTIGNGVTTIGNYNFSGCTSLTSVTIGNGVTSIGDYAFNDCTSLTSITIPDNVTEIGYEAFSGCTSLTSVTIPDSVKSIDYKAFMDCTSLTNITIGNGVTSIGFQAFYNCTSLTSITIPDGVTYIDVSAFADCTSLTSITIPDSVTSIGDRAFMDCTSLTSVNIPDGVTSIGEYAFSGCTSLTSITIPDSVTEIGYYAFENTAYYNNESNWENSLLYIGNHLIKAKEDVSGNFEIKQGTKTIADSAFYDCTSLTSITIPAGVKEIGDLAFGYYYDIIKNKVKTVDGFTIYGNRGSEAERYANENGFKFVAIGDAPTMTFPDVRSGDWYSDAVKYNFERGYITGYSNGTFGPANNIQRQDFVLILARIAGVDLSAYEGQNGGFSDVQAGTYYASAVAWAKDAGVVNGFSADNFGVGTYISREQICVIFSRYLNGSASGDVDAIINAYPDGGNTSSWAKAGVAWAIENGIIGNAGYINPTGNAGRAEVAQIIYNMANNGIL